MTSGPSRWAWKNATASSTRGANRSSVVATEKLGDEAATPPDSTTR